MSSPIVLSDFSLAITPSSSLPSLPHASIYFIRHYSPTRKEGTQAPITIGHPPRGYTQAHPSRLRSRHHGIATEVRFALTDTDLRPPTPPGTGSIRNPDTYPHLPYVYPPAPHVDTKKRALFRERAALSARLTLRFPLRLRCPSPSLSLQSP